MALSRTQILPAVLALVVAAGTASAIYTPKTSTCPPEGQARKQQPGQTAPRARHHAPVSDMVFTTPRTTTTFGQADEPQTDTNQVSVFSQTCPEGQCTIKIENGQVTALRDGQPVAGRLIQRDGEQIRVMGEDGQQVMVVRVSPDGGSHVGDGRSAPRNARRTPVSPGAAPQQSVIVRGQPLPRRAMRVAPHGAQTFEFHAVPGTPMTPMTPMTRGTPGTPGTPNAPGQPRILQWQGHAPGGAGGEWTAQDGQTYRFHAAPGTQAGEAHTFQRSGEAPAGQPNVIIRHHGAPGAQVVPGGGAGGGQGGSYTFRMDNAQGGPAAAAGSCCDDCKQDGSCCDCGGGATSGGSHGAGSRSFSRAGQIVIDTGNGQPRVIELGDLGGHMGQLQEHLLHLQPHIQNHVQGHLQPHMDQLHHQLLQLREIEGLDLGGLNLDNLADGIELQIESALQGLNSGELELQIEAMVEDALSGLDMDNLGEQIQLHLEQTLLDGGLSGDWKTEDGEAAYTLGVVPELLADGGGRVATGTDDRAPHAAHAQPAAPVQNRVRVAPSGRVQPSQGSGGGSGGAAGARTGQVVTTEQPKVMLGITMGEAPAELLEQIGLEPGSAIRVDSVIDGLPAAEAGLKSGSIIIAIDGESPATSTLLRERLMQLSPGDTLSLKVVRGGQRLVLDVQLVEYDAEALKLATGAPLDESQNHTFNFQGLSQGGNHEQLQQRIREAVTAMSEGGATSINELVLRQKIEAIVRDHMTVMGGQAQGGATAPRRMLMAPGAHDGREGEMVFVTPGQPMTPVPPASVIHERRPDVDARLAGMEQRLANLEQRLDRIAELLEQRRAPRD